MDDVLAADAAPDPLSPPIAAALIRQMPLPMALLDAAGTQVLVGNAALARRCGCPEDALRGLSLAQLRSTCGAGEDAQAGRAGGCAHLHPVELEGREVMLWLADHCRGDAVNGERDERTGLLSRRAFEERMRTSLARQADGVLVRVEVDQFKLINDAYGREAGDRLISELARLIAGHVRDGDEPAYLGGDEFALVLEQTDVDRAWQVAERIRLQIAAQGFEWSGRPYGVTVSMGIAAFGDAFGDYTELMAAAGTAAAAAKSRGRNRIEIYHRQDRELSRMRGEQSWGARVLDILEANRFALYRQRIDALRPDAGIQHYEALLRVRGAAGWGTPGDFVAAAERYGLMPQVDRRVIARVLRELSRVPPDQRPVIAVNLSGHTLSDQGLAGYIARMLEYHEVSGRNVIFEITETAAIANTSRAVALVNALKELGCAVALDDFGAGMSSFSYLKTLAVDILKIDGSFVRNVASDPVDAATIESMVKVARLRGLRTIAECVEDAASLARLDELGVDYAQGFYLHRPEPWSLP